MGDDLLPTAPCQSPAESLAEQCEILVLNVTEKRKTFPAQCSMMLSKTLKKEMQHLMSPRVEVPQLDHTSRKPLTAGAQESLPPLDALALQSVMDKMNAMTERLQKATAILEQVEREGADGVHQLIRELDS